MPDRIQQKALLVCVEQYQKYAKSAENQGFDELASFWYRMMQGNLGYDPFRRTKEAQARWLYGERHG